MKLGAYGRYLELNGKAFEHHLRLAALKSAMHLAAGCIDLPVPRNLHGSD